MRGRITWDTAQHEALDTLRALIRLDTSNPPGNERLATDYLAGALCGHGLVPVIRESAPTRANLVARIAGASPAEGALMLSSHTDVVPVEHASWNRAPFGAEIAGGCVWGRGAIDMKSKTAMDLVLMTAIARAGVKPWRSVVMAAVADEEAGSGHGAGFLVERHPELVRAAYVLNEVGGFTVHMNGDRYYPIQVAEKGFVTLRMTVRDAPGHGSTPRRQNAISKLAALVTKLTDTPMRERMTPLMRATLTELKVPLDTPPPIFHAMLSNTVSPTILRAGYKDNVIPGEASVVLDGRTLPGETPESFVAELRAMVGEEPVLEMIKSAPPVEASSDTPLFELIADRIRCHDPGSRPLAWMIPGATDNKYYARLGAVCYGFAPVKLGPDTPFGALYHGNDERLPIEGFYWGLRLYADVVLSFVGLKFEDVFA